MPIGKGQGKVAMLKRQEAISLQELIAALQDAHAKLAGKVSKAASNPKAVAAASARNDLFAQVGGVYRVLSIEMDAIMKEIAEKAAVDWHKEALSDIEATGVKLPASVVKFDRARLKRVWEIVSPDNTQNLAAVFTQKMAQDDIRKLRQSFMDTWRLGEVEGLTLTERHKLLQEKWDKQAGDLAGDRFIDSAGKQWSNAHYLDMLVRTTSARVARDSYFDTLATNGDDLVQIENVDGEACPICQAWDGVILSISGASKDYPSYQQALSAGMFHPQCRCMTERVDETIDKAEIAKQAGTPTPDLEPEDDEGPTEYKKRVTAAVAGYSEDFTVSTPETTARARAEKPITEAKQALADRSDFTPTGDLRIPSESEINDEALRKMALASFRNGTIKTATTPGIDGDIDIPIRGMKHALHYLPGREKSVLAEAIPTLLSHGEVIAKETDRHGRPEIKAVYKIRAAVKIGGKDRSVIIVVRDTNMGLKYYDHYLE